MPHIHWSHTKLYVRITYGREHLGQRIYKQRPRNLARYLNLYIMMLYSDALRTELRPISYDNSRITLRASGVHTSGEMHYRLICIWIIPRYVH